MLQVHHHHQHHLHQQQQQQQQSQQQQEKQQQNTVVILGDTLEQQQQHSHPRDNQHLVSCPKKTQITHTSLTIINSNQEQDNGIIRCDEANNNNNNNDEEKKEATLTETHIKVKSPTGPSKAHFQQQHQKQQHSQPQTAAMKSRLKQPVATSTTLASWPTHQSSSISTSSLLLTPAPANVQLPSSSSASSSLVSSSSSSTCSPEQDTSTTSSSSIQHQQQQQKELPSPNTANQQQQQQQKTAVNRFAKLISTTSTTTHVTTTNAAEITAAKNCTRPTSLALKTTNLINVNSSSTAAPAITSRTQPTNNSTLPTKLKAPLTSTTRLSSAVKIGSLAASKCETKNPALNSLPNNDNNNNKVQSSQFGLRRKHSITAATATITRQSTYNLNTSNGPSNNKNPLSVDSSHLSNGSSGGDHLKNLVAVVHPQHSQRVNSSAKIATTVNNNNKLGPQPPTTTTSTIAKSRSSTAVYNSKTVTTTSTNKRVSIVRNKETRQDERQITLAGQSRNHKPSAATTTVTANTTSTSSSLASSNYTTSTSSKPSQLLQTKSRLKGSSNNNLAQNINSATKNGQFYLKQEAAKQQLRNNITTTTTTTSTNDNGGGGHSLMTATNNKINASCDSHLDKKKYPPVTNIATTNNKQSNKHFHKRQPTDAVISKKHVTSEEEQDDDDDDEGEEENLLSNSNSNHHDHDNNGNSFGHHDCDEAAAAVAAGGGFKSTLTKSPAIYFNSSACSGVEGDEHDDHCDNVQLETSHSLLINDQIRRPKPMGQQVLSLMMLDVGLLPANNNITNNNTSSPTLDCLKTPKEHDHHQQEQSGGKLHSPSAKRKKSHVRLASPTKHYIDQECNNKRSAIPVLPGACSEMLRVQVKLSRKDNETLKSISLPCSPRRSNDLLSTGEEQQHSAQHQHHHQRRRHRHRLEKRNNLSSLLAKSDVATADEDDDDDEQQQHEYSKFLLNSANLSCPSNSSNLHSSSAAYLLRESLEEDNSSDFFSHHSSSSYQKAQSSLSHHNTDHHHHHYHQQQEHRVTTSTRLSTNKNKNKNLLDSRSLASSSNSLLNHHHQCPPLLTLLNQLDSFRIRELVRTNSSSVIKDSQTCLSSLDKVVQVEKKHESLLVSHNNHNNNYNDYTASPSSSSSSNSEQDYYKNKINDAHRKRMMLASESENNNNNNNLVENNNSQQTDSACDPSSELILSDESSFLLNQQLRNNNTNTSNNMDPILNKRQHQPRSHSIGGHDYYSNGTYQRLKQSVYAQQNVYDQQHHHHQQHSPQSMYYAQQPTQLATHQLHSLQPNNSTTTSTTTTTPVNSPYLQTHQPLTSLSVGGRAPSPLNISCGIGTEYDPSLTSKYNLSRQLQRNQQHHASLECLNSGTGGGYSTHDAQNHHQSQKVHSYYQSMQHQQQQLQQQLHQQNHSQQLASQYHHHHQQQQQLQQLQQHQHQLQQQAASNNQQHYASSYLTGGATSPSTPTNNMKNVNQDHLPSSTVVSPPMPQYHQATPNTATCKSPTSSNTSSSHYSSHTQNLINRAMAQVSQSPLRRMGLNGATTNNTGASSNSFLNQLSNSHHPMRHSSLSLTSSSFVEEKLQNEIKKLQCELKSEKEKNEALNSQLEINNGLMGAFEQSLTTLNNRLRQLTALNEEKDDEINELKDQLKSLKLTTPESSEKKGLTSIVVNHLTKEEQEVDYDELVNQGDRASESNLLEVIEDLKAQLRKKDRLLTESRLEAFEAVHQLEKLEARLNGDHNSLLVNEDELDEGVMVVNHSPSDSEAVTDSGHLTEINDQLSKTTNQRFRGDSLYTTLTSSSDNTNQLTSYHSNNLTIDVNTSNNNRDNRSEHLCDCNESTKSNDHLNGVNKSISQQLNGSDSGLASDLMDNLQLNC